MPGEAIDDDKGTPQSSIRTEDSDFQYFLEFPAVGSSLGEGVAPVTPAAFALAHATSFFAQLKCWLSTIKPGIRKTQPGIMGRMRPAMPIATRQKPPMI